MIIGHEGKPMVIGQIYKGLFDLKSEAHPGQPFIVLRVATRTEWLAEALRDGIAEAECHQILASAPMAQFYEISVD